MMVSLQWLWRYLTFERGARVMTEESFDVRTARLPTRTRTSGK